MGRPQENEAIWVFPAEVLDMTVSEPSDESGPHHHLTESSWETISKNHLTEPRQPPELSDNDQWLLLPCKNYVIPWDACLSSGSSTIYHPSEQPDDLQKVQMVSCCPVFRLTLQRLSYYGKTIIWLPHFKVLLPTRLSKSLPTPADSPALLHSH